MNYGILCGLLLSSAVGHASYFQVCELRATVTGVQAAAKLNGHVERRQGVNTYVPTIALVIDAVKKLPGSHDGCERLLRETRLLTLNEQETASYTVGQKLTIDYRYGNSRGPEGGQSFETWTVKQ